MEKVPAVAVHLCGAETMCNSYIPNCMWATQNLKNHKTDLLTKSKFKYNLSVIQGGKFNHTLKTDK